MGKRILLCACLLGLPMLVQAEGVRVGQPAPDLSLPSLNSGERIALSSLAGKVVYLDFWASWCGPCRLSFPELEMLRQELAGRGFEVYAVSVDELPADALRFLEELPVSYPVVIDVSASAPNAYGVLGMPTGYLIDRKGVVRQVHRGYKKGDGAELRTAIVTLLAEP